MGKVTHKVPCKCLFSILLDNPDDRCSRVRNMYSGSMNNSFSGKECLRWEENRHHLPGDIEDLMFPDISLIAAASYCRDPLGNGYLWCFVDENGNWEPCLLEGLNTSLTKNLFSF